MDHDTRNPCELCEDTSECAECVLHRPGEIVTYCAADRCFLNYEGSCMIGIYDDCGCRKAFDKEVRDG